MAAKPASLDSVLEPVFDKFLKEIEGLNGMIVSTSDSIGLGQAWKEEEEGNSIVATVFPFVVDQLSKLQWGSIRALTAQYQSARLCHVYAAPLIFTFVGTPDLDVETLTSEKMINKLQQGFAPLQAACR